MIELDKTKALVVLSGGQDSTTCLYQAKSECDEVHAVTFDYGQRHNAELDAAQKIAQMAEVASHEVVGLDSDTLVSTSPLTDPQVGVEHYEDPNDMPGGVEPTFVPGRNALFLVLAANRAYRLGCGRIYIGVSQEDYGGYFDCRETFITQMSVSINQALFGQFVGIDIVAPLLFMSKRDTVLLAKQLPGCWAALAFSHTCYDGEYPPNPQNHASILRAAGFKASGHPDPLISRAKSEGLLPDDYPSDGYVFETKYARGVE